MRAKPSLEQALCIVALLGIQDRKVPLHSRLVAERLDISTSYLKKIVQKLAAGGIVKTVSGRDGGIVLTKDPVKITLLDVFNAIEGTTAFVHSTGVVSKVFGLEHKDAFMETYHLKDFKDTRPVANVLSVFAQAEDRFRQELATLSIGDVLPTTGDQCLQLDWTKWLTR
ncbi:Rrf2 family transcriptional regulator [Levilactobacillus brevis]|uniref:Rrf2 family transcriptional regulator n=1 Tax=Levilactobacillus hammesii TaxID=267633 RepID=A0A921JVY8_9LACO|nr:Rrf2 family transcriptional regulator [Levilactobacillus brevis]HJE86289.1 Rrf2 family transcriptional regulator [Levilactobacillus hammesii]